MDHRRIGPVAIKILPRGADLALSSPRFPRSGILVIEMPLFAIMAPLESPALVAALQVHYPQNHLKVGTGQWIVAGPGTAIEISNSLGITSGESGSGIVCLIGGYYGRTANNIWEWMATKGKT